MLSRRPGRVRDVIAVDVPLADRKDGAPELEALREQLWQGIRDEAQAADQELADV